MGLVWQYKLKENQEAVKADRKTEEAAMGVVKQWFERDSMSSTGQFSAFLPLRRKN